MDLTLFLYSLLSASILFLGFVLVKKVFFKLALASSALLNVLIDFELDEDLKQQKLLKNLGPTILYLTLLLLLTFTVYFLVVLPYMIYLGEVRFDSIPKEIMFWDSILAHGIVYLIYYLLSRSKKESYSDWSKLLHRIILNNYSIGRFLFKRAIRNQSETKHSKVIVTGLARSGTTALTNDLFDSGRFYSLDYSVMPFLMSPKLGKKLNRKKKELKERAHGDQVLVGLNSIEALEEYFFKSLKKDSFISDSNLKQYDLSTDELKVYESYLSILKDKDKCYLAKNNNFILRAKSHLEIDQNLKVIWMIRNPIEQAQSLLYQHLKFSKLQEDDPFVLEYMDWLGHHEFGLNQIPFDLGKIKLIEDYKKIEINYWLASWLNYYSELLSLRSNEKVILINYDDFVNDRTKTLSTIFEFCDIDRSIQTKDKFESRSYKTSSSVSEDLLKQCNKVFESLTNC